MTKSVAVFCGSSPGKSPAYTEAARQMGAEIAARGWRMVYGGASVGLMGVAADAALAGGAEVIGVLPTFLSGKEVAHSGLSALHIVANQEERKAEMLTRSDLVAILPGGLGTLDEAFETWTGTQLKLWRKPVGFLNVDGYYDYLKRFLDHAANEGFIRPSHMHAAIYDHDVACLLDALHAWTLPRPKFANREAPWLNPQSV